MQIVNSVKTEGLRHLSARFRGFTLIELMIVVAIIAIILTLALPVYTNYTIRAKVGEALSVTASAKTAISDTCTTDPSIPSLDNDRAGYHFEPSEYVESVVISGPCTAPVITINTQNTGATTNPVVIITGRNVVGEERISWTCTIASGQNIYVPEACRS